MITQRNIHWLIKGIIRKSFWNKKIYNQYLDKRVEIMKNTSYLSRRCFGDLLGKQRIFSEQTTKWKKFSAKVM